MTWKQNQLITLQSPLTYDMRPRSKTYKKCNCWNRRRTIQKRVLCYGVLDSHEFKLYVACASLKKSALLLDGEVKRMLYP